MTPKQKQLLFAALTAAFLLRLAVRLASSEAAFWVNGYSDYYDLPQNLVQGKGLCFDTTCAWWTPLYPLFLAATALGGMHYLLVVVPQALMGAATAMCAFLTARRLFGVNAGLIACSMAAVYPYYVAHDTALWIANNPETFSHYPRGSIDLSTAEAYSKMPPAEQSELDRLTNEIEASDWYERCARDYIQTHPGLTARRPLVKVGAGFWWRLNPVRDGLAQAAWCSGRTRAIAPTWTSIGWSSPRERSRACCRACAS